MAAPLPSDPIPDGLSCLTDKEKETLRLIVRGHDAKSMARHLDLSVHTVNERLRSARRKLSVTSSREAARLLFEHEGNTPQMFGDKELGDGGQATSSNAHSILQPGRNPAHWIGAILIMSALGLIFALNFSGAVIADREIGDPSTAIEQDQLEQIERNARQWLELVDAGDWEASFASAGQTFQDLNTVAAWRSASQDARVPLGAMVRRKVTTAEFVNAPPRGYYIVRFRTQFEERNEAIESVTLENDHGLWKVVGYVID